MGRDFAGRDMYIYYKDCTVVKSHKLRDVIARRGISLEFAAELKDPDAGKFQEKFPNYIRPIEERLDSECIGEQFGQSGVYDGTQVIMNIYRIPGSGSKDKDNPREGLGAR